MTNISNLTTSQLKSIIAIKEQIEALEAQMDAIAGGGEIPSPATKKAPAPKRKYHMTASHRRKLIKALAKARKIRMANLKGKAKGKSKAAKKKDKRSSPAVRAKLAAAAKARWARVKAEGRKGL